MGQYYRIYLKHKLTQMENCYKMETIDNLFFGSKLMEHSYFGNPAINFVMREIYYHPKQVAWVGDYTNERNNKKYEYIYNFCYGEFARLNLIPSEGEFDIKPEYNFLINLDKKEYIDVEEYKNNSAILQTYTDNLSNYSCEYKDLVINPIPLLTSTSNELGRGDYDGINNEYVGSWSLDELIILSKIEELSEFNYNPKDFKKINISFIENIYKKRPLLKDVVKLNKEQKTKVENYLKELEEELISKSLLKVSIEYLKENDELNLYLIINSEKNLLFGEQIFNSFYDSIISSKSNKQDKRFEYYLELIYKKALEEKIISFNNTAEEYLKKVFESLKFRINFEINNFYPQIKNKDNLKLDFSDEIKKVLLILDFDNIFSFEMDKYYKFNEIVEDIQKEIRNFSTAYYSFNRFIFYLDEKYGEKIKFEYKHHEHMINLIDLENNKKFKTVKLELRNKKYLTEYEKQTSKDYILPYEKDEKYFEKIIDNYLKSKKQKEMI